MFTRWHGSVMAGAALVMFGAAITFTGFAFFNGPVSTELGFTVSAFTLYYTLYGLFTAVAMPLAGRLAGRLGARALLALGGAVAIAGLLLFAAGSTLPVFYAAGVLVGVGYGLSVQFAPVVLVNTWFVESRGLVMGLVLAGSGVGGALLSLTVPVLIDAAGWRVAMLAMAATMAVATLVPAAFLVRNEPSDVGVTALGARHLAPEDDGDGAGSPSGVTVAEEVTTARGEEVQGGLLARRRAWLMGRRAKAREWARDTVADFGGVLMGEALRTPWMVILVAALFLLGAVNSMGQHIPNHLGSLTGIGTAEISAAMTVMTLGLVVMKPGIGLLADRIGLRAAVTISLTVFALTSAVSVLVTSAALWLLVMVGLAAGLANGTVTPPLVGVRAFGPRDFARIWGIIGTAYPVGMAVGTPLWGAVKDRLGSYEWAFASVPLWIALVLLGFALAVRGGRRMWVVGR